MRITQAHISDSVSDFPFKVALRLTGYIDSSRPLVVFGVYSDRDMDIILNHKSKVMVVWCGQDAVDCIFFGRYMSLKHVTHITWLTNVERALKSFLDIKLVPPVFLGGNFKPYELGDKVFVYAPSSSPRYHGSNVILELMDLMPELTFELGNGMFSQEEWLSSVGDICYSRCFVGLCLSGFAGGAQTVMQMGLKGITVVTNVIEMPHTRRWESIHDICEVIKQERSKIGTVQNKIAESVELQLKKDEIWLNV